MGTRWRRLGRWTFGVAFATAAVGVAAGDARATILLADLSITKTDGVASVAPGDSVTYTVTASNAGPNPVTGVTVVDPMPAGLTAVAWTCSGAGGGTCGSATGPGNIADVVNLPVGASVTYTISATVSLDAAGVLVNTATVVAPGSVLDANTANNSAADTDTIIGQAGLAITKTDGVTSATPGSTVTYTIAAVNTGPSDAPGATVTDTFPASLTDVSWICAGTGGGTCAPSGTGDISDAVDLPAGATVTYTVTATIAGDATGTLTNTATVAAPAGFVDPNPGNNTASDVDDLVLPPPTTSTTTTSTVAPMEPATTAPTTTLAAVPPTPATVAPAATASLPATGSSAAARIAPWALVLIAIGAAGVVIAARRTTRRS